MLPLALAAAGCGRSRVAGLDDNVGFDEAGSGGSRAGSGGSRAGSGGSRAGSGGSGAGSGGSRAGSGGSRAGAGGSIAGSGGQSGFGGPAGGPPPMNPYCGNGRAEGFEECDYNDLRGATCETMGFDGGMLGCDRMACVLRYEGCYVDQRSCGNGIREPGESCDLMDLGGQTCASVGLISGYLGCTPRCTLDTTGCSVCGDGVIGPGETCDGTRLQGQTCTSLGYSGGRLGCSSSCSYDVSGCAFCGDGIVSAGENCERNDLAGASCESLGLGSGTLACSVLTCHFDTRGCSAGSSCGNNIAEAEEQCDGADLAGHDCRSLGLGRGTLQCNSGTCRYDTSGCVRESGRECVTRCTESNCSTILAMCDMTPGCNEIRSCLDRCHQDFSPSCAFNCASGAIGAIAVATTASDCVADCAFDCR